MRISESLPCCEQAVGKEGNNNSGPSSRHFIPQITLYYSCDMLDMMEGKQNTNLDALGFSFKAHGIVVVEFLLSGIYSPLGSCSGHQGIEFQRINNFTLIFTKFLSKINCAFPSEARGIFFFLSSVTGTVSPSNSFFPYRIIRKTLCSCIQAWFLMCKSKALKFSKAFRL